MLAGVEQAAKSHPGEETARLIPYSSLSQTERHTVIINGGARFVLRRLWDTSTVANSWDERSDAADEQYIPGDNQLHS